MTKKDYIKIVTVLRRARLCRSEYCQHAMQWKAVVSTMSDMLYSDSGMTPNGNRRFDRDLFLMACNA